MQTLGSTGKWQRSAASVPPVPQLSLEALRRYSVVASTKSRFASASPRIEIWGERGGLDWRGITNAKAKCPISPAIVTRFKFNIGCHIGLLQYTIYPLLLLPVGLVLPCQL